MTVGAAAMEPITPTRTRASAVTAMITRRRSKKTYRTPRRMSLGTIWISIMTQHPPGTAGAWQYNTEGSAHERVRLSGRRLRLGAFEHQPLDHQRNQDQRDEQCAYHRQPFQRVAFAHGAVDQRVGAVGEDDVRGDEAQERGQRVVAEAHA